LFDILLTFVAAGKDSSWSCLPGPKRAKLAIVVLE
jgi:hypothetical protein